jgi:tRNA (adenine57-N1/adenine58-N1)-methyltransferase catalytic subunit
MDFALPLIETESTASKSNIRYLEPVTAETASGATPEERERNVDLDNQVIDAANFVAYELFHGSSSNNTTSPFLPSNETHESKPNGKTKRYDPKKGYMIDSSAYKDRTIPSHSTIQPDDLVVIQESFDTLDFVYVKANAIYQNRNGNFHHNDFINQPFGTKVRSRDLRGYGFIYLLKPTPELWTRSLNHRTQVVHELDQSQIIFQLYIKPNDIVVESGTGSGAMSHSLIRTIAPSGHVHTYEFNQHRAETARTEFRQHGLQHLVTVYHKDVCRGLVEVETNHSSSNDKESKSIGATMVQEGTPGFDLPGQSVNAVFLDLPEPWLAVPHAAYALKPNGRIASYSPCVEQTQKTVAALEKAGFHSVKTMEYRLQEHYVDEYEFEPPPFQKQSRPEPHDTTIYQSLAGGDDQIDDYNVDNNGNARSDDDILDPNDAKNSANDTTQSALIDTDKKRNNDATIKSSLKDNRTNKKRKNRSILVARPFVTMRGHTAFLTFATSGLQMQPDPNHGKDS